MIYSIWMTKFITSIHFLSYFSTQILLWMKKDKMYIRVRLQKSLPTFFVSILAKHTCNLLDFEVSLTSSGSDY